MTQQHYPDEAYLEVDYVPPQIEHNYGEGVFLLKDPLALTALARFGSPSMPTRETDWLVEVLTFSLLRGVIHTSFPRCVTAVDTRMRAYTPAGRWTGEVIDPATRVNVVVIMRAGGPPSNIAYSYLRSMLDAEGVHRNHLTMERQTGPNGEIIGVKVDEDKFGRAADDAFCLILDPMGATGVSSCEALDNLRKRNMKVKKFILGFFIVTPECIKALKDQHFDKEGQPPVEIFALRLDRGMSPNHVLQTPPGTHWDQECGLTAKGYIVPGAGDVGEVLNNA